MDAFESATKRGDAALKSGHVEIDHVVVVAEGLFERTEAVSFGKQPILDCGNASAEVGHDDFELWKAVEHTASNQSRRRHGEIHLPTQHARQVIVLKMLVAGRHQSGVNEDRN